MPLYWEEAVRSTQYKCNHVPGTSEEDEYYHYWPGDIKRWTPRALLQNLNIDGKRVWEPPIFAHNDLTGEAYEEKCEALLKFMEDDRAKATAILDVDMEIDLLAIYGRWISENMDAARDPQSSDRAIPRILLEYLTEPSPTHHRHSHILVTTSTPPSSYHSHDS